MLEKYSQWLPAFYFKMNPKCVQHSFQNYEYRLIFPYSISVVRDDNINFNDISVNWLFKKTIKYLNKKFTQFLKRFF